MMDHPSQRQTNKQRRGSAGTIRFEKTLSPQATYQHHSLFSTPLHSTTQRLTSPPPTTTTKILAAKHRTSLSAHSQTHRLVFRRVTLFLPPPMRRAKAKVGGARRRQDKAMKPRSLG